MPSFVGGPLSVQSYRNLPTLAAIYHPHLTNEDTDVKRLTDSPKDALLLILDPCLKSSLTEYTEHRWTLDLNF